MKDSQTTQAMVKEQKKSISAQVEEICTAYDGKKEELIPLLQKVQNILGYVPEQAMSKIAQFVGVSESTVFGVTTFYAQFRLVPSGRTVLKVCCGTACHVRGGNKLLEKLEKKLGIKAGGTTPDMEYSLETTACFGACALAPVVVVNNNVHGRLKAADVNKMIENNNE